MTASILVVDDEPITVRWIESQIITKQDDFVILGHASNGTEALELLTGSLRPDVVITDIRMPVMNGIELMREVRRLNLSVEFLVLSSYSDFRYASEAIRLGAGDYLLKNDLVPDDLIRALRRLASRRHDRSARTSRARGLPSSPRVPDHTADRERALDSMLMSPAGPAAELLSSLREPGAAAVLVEWSAERTAGVAPWPAVDRVSRLIRERLDASCSVVVAPGSILLSLGRGGRAAEVGADVLAVVSTTVDDLQAEYGLSMAAGVAVQTALDPEPVRTVREAQTALDTLYFYRETSPGDGCVAVLYGELVDNWTNVQEQHAGFFLALSLGNTAEVAHRAGSILDRIERVLMVPHTTATDLVARILYAVSQRAGIHHLLSSAERVSEIADVARDDVSRYGAQPMLSGSQSPDPVERALDYMLRHFGDRQLSLQATADAVSLSATYLSDLFRRRTGKTFQESLSQIRLEKATYLLTQSVVPVTDIAAIVGFSSLSAFGRFVKRHTGLSPLELRSRHEHNATDSDSTVSGVVRYEPVVESPEASDQD